MSPRLCQFVLATMLGMPLARDGKTPHLGIRQLNPRTYEITQRITVINHDVSNLDLLELNLPIPTDASGQKVSKVSVKGDEPVRLDDVHKRGKITRSLYKGDRPPPLPGETKSLSVAYTLTRWEIATDKDKLARRTYRPYQPNSKEVRLFMQEEKNLEIDNPAIRDIAIMLKRQFENPYERARAAYDYVIDHTQYGVTPGSLSAKHCLRLGKGDCGAYTLLFVAICRSAGIPARPIAGCWAEGDNQWHCWAEFYLPGVGWVPADPTAADTNPAKREYYFGNMDNNRVTLASTFNFTVDCKEGSKELGFVQVGTWWWYPAKGSSGSKMEVQHHFRGKRK